VDAINFQRGLTLFNTGEYFDAHEVWEDVWRAAPQEQKKFLQGLIQIAVALHHHSRGNTVGAGSLLARALRNLAKYPDSYAGVNLGSVRVAIRDCQHAVDTCSALPPFTISIS
jgi:predicted metal-dependent hydrolase